MLAYPGTSTVDSIYGGARHFENAQAPLTSGMIVNQLK
jgi:hypothetical protein